MKAFLTQDSVRKLELGKKPVGIDSKGKIIVEDNPSLTKYIIFDASQDAPPGFGVRVYPSKKVYVLQRRVGKSVFKATVGNCADMSIREARERASKMALEMKDSGKNPVVAKRDQIALEQGVLLGEIMNAHSNHLQTRTQMPASAATVKVLNRAFRKFESFGWTKRKVTEITVDEIKDKFVEGRTAPSANEQNFRIATHAVRWKIGKEMLRARSAKCDPVISGNPFDILALDGMYRSTRDIDRERSLNGRRNPLTPSGNLGDFLEAAWSKRNSNNNWTGVCFLVLMLLWGCRKSEHSKCVWGEFLTEQERKRTSHVWLGTDGKSEPYVFFYDTKNHLDHRLPLAPMAIALLKKHQEILAAQFAETGFGTTKRKWVFPAKNKLSKTGHYSNPNELLDSIRDEAGIAVLCRHDLRRSFGSVMMTIDVPLGLQKRFFNHKSRGEHSVGGEEGVTRIYTEAEWALMKEWMIKIEQAIITKAPNVYNALKPAEWEPLPAPPPHVCKPPKPRTGRPRKALTAVTEIKSDISTE